VGLLASSETLRKSVGAALLPFLRRLLEKSRDEARRALGAETFDDGWADGSTWTLGVAVGEAAKVLQTDVPDAAAAPSFAARSSRRTNDESATTQREATFRRDGDFWTIGYAAPAFRLKDMLGASYLAQLLSTPHREWHVFDLAVARDPSVPKGSFSEYSRSDAGPILDDEAKRAYRQRLQELAEDLEEAERWSDIERAEHARTEIDALTDQLVSAVGLGGRDRKAASEAERIRVNATKAIRSAIRRITINDAALGQHLERSVRTGVFCSYTPDVAAEVTWRL
jgi:non-specific serine/threonine protein kinase